MNNQVPQDMKLRPTFQEKQQPLDNTQTTYNKWDKTQSDNKFAESKSQEWMTWDQRHPHQPKPLSTQQINTSLESVQAAPQQHKSVNQIWNSKPYPGYNLKFYNYFSDTLEMDHQVENYMKYNTKTLKPPQLNYYVRYNPSIYESEIDEKSGQYYSSLMEDTTSSSNLVYNKQYQGVYSKQPDYYHFKQELRQNNQKENQKQ